MHSVDPPDQGPQAWPLWLLLLGESRSGELAPCYCIIQATACEISSSSGLYADLTTEEQAQLSLLRENLNTASAIIAPTGGLVSWKLAECHPLAEGQELPSELQNETGTKCWSNLSQRMRDTMSGLVLENGQHVGQCLAGAALHVVRVLPTLGGRLARRRPEVLCTPRPCAAALRIIPAAKPHLPV